MKKLETIRDLVSKGNLGKALKELDQLNLSLGIEGKSKVIALQQQLNTIESDFNKGIIKYEEKTLGLNRITNTIIYKLDQIEENLNSAVKSQRTKIKEDLDYKGIVAEYVLHNTFGDAFKKLASISELIKNTKKEKVNTTLKSSEDEMLERLGFQIKKAYNWSGEINFRDLKEKKYLTNVFIPLDFYLTPKRLELITSNKKENKKSLSKVIDDIQENLVILGSPGAGKTTTLKYLCNLSLSETDKSKKKFSCPIVLRLRDYNSIGKKDYHSKGFLCMMLMEYLGIKIHIPKDISDYEESYIKSKFKVETYKFIDDLNFLILIDGFDELQNNSLKKLLIDEINDIAISLDNAKFILTSRTGDFHYSFRNTKIYEICALSEPQIEEFINKWMQNNRKAKVLLKQIGNSPYADAAMRPLTLAHLCAIFERYKKIPDKPIDMYVKIIRLLLEEWDLQRNIDRKSLYSNFTVDRKIKFLTSLAFLLTTTHSATTFERNQLNSCYQELCVKFDLPPNHVKRVVDELESHNGLFIQAGYDSFEFAHKSLQEFLTAKYISGLPFIPNDSKMLLSIPNELAIAVALSSMPSLYFSNLIMKKLDKRCNDVNFISPFIARLELEKPDFDDKPSLSATYLFIITNLLKNNDEATNAIVSNLISIMNNSIVIINSTKYLGDFYRRNERVPFKYSKIPNVEFLELARKKSMREILGFESPRYLFIPNDYYIKRFITLK